MIYKEVEVINLSLLFIATYFTFKSKKSKNLLLILGYVFLNLNFIILDSSNLEIIKYLRLNIYTFLFVILVKRVYNSNEIKKNTYLFLYFQCLLSIFITILFNMRQILRYEYIIVLGIVYITDVILILKLNKNKKISNKKIIILILFFTSIAIEFLPIDKLIISSLIRLYINYYIFIKLINIHIINVNEKLNQNNTLIIENNDKVKELTETLREYRTNNQVLNTTSDIKANILETILNQNNQCVLIIDNIGYISSENQNFVNMWPEYKNYKYKIKATSFFEKHMENYSQIMFNIQKVYDTGIEVNDEIVSVDNRYFECSYSPLKIKGTILAVVCVLNDITYNKKSKLKIEENNIKYKKIIETIPYTILLTDEEDILYKNKSDIDSDNLKKIQKIVSEKNICEYEYNDHRTNRYLNIKKTSFYEENKIQNLVIIKDITKYKNLLLNVKKSKDKYEKLVNTIPEGIYVSDLSNQNYIYANNGILNILGIKNKSELESKDISNIMNFKVRNLKEGIIFERHKFIKDNGEEKYIESAGMILDINKRPKAIGIIRDVTEQVNSEIIEIEIEKRKIKDKIKMEFFVNLSHELKTPLNVIFASNQLLQSIFRDKIEEDENSEISMCTKIVKKNSYILLRLINNIMTLTKLEADFYIPKKDYYDAISVIENTIMEFGVHLESDNVNIIFDTDIEEKIINVDPEDLEKIILNLLSNAVKFKKDKSNIYVNLYDELDNLKVIIKDDGTGIDKEKIDSILENKSLYVKYKQGANMGLIITKSLVEFYKGTINIKNIANGGTEVTLTLPTVDDLCYYDVKDKIINPENVYAEYASTIAL